MAKSAHAWLSSSTALPVSLAAQPTLYMQAFVRNIHDLHLLNGVPARAGAEKGPSSRRGRADTEGAEGDSASSVSASTLASLRDDFGEEDLADEHPLERLIDALYEKRCVAAPMHAPPQEQ